MFPPKRNSRIKLLWISAAFAALILALYWFVPSKPCISFSGYRSGETYLLLDAEQHTEFSVSFTHSVNKSYVEDFYQLRDDGIYLTHTRYQTFGAGMTTDMLADGGAYWYEEDGYMVIGGFERLLDPLTLTVGYVAEHILHVEDEVMPLTDFAASGTTLLIEKKTCSRAAYLRHGLNI